MEGSCRAEAGLPRLPPLLPPTCLWPLLSLLLTCALALALAGTCRLRCARKLWLRLK